MIVFMLAHCEECKIQYAITPDPYFSQQYILFDRNKSIEYPTHITVGAILCFRGNELQITAKEAVCSESGDWISVEGTHVLDSQN